MQVKWMKTIFISLIFTARAGRRLPYPTGRAYSAHVIKAEASA